MDWEWVDAVGTSGGLLCFWNPGIFKRVQTYKHWYFLVVSVTSTNFIGIVNLVNVYAPQGLNAKKELWDSITEYMETRTGMWVLMGDFNSVRYPEERLHSDFDPACASAFNNFIEENGLLEYLMGGRKFTRVSRAGDKLSKIDRFLVNQAFWNSWPDATVLALPRRDSDHSPISLSTQTVNFGAPPFRFFNSWLSKPGFEEIVKGAIGNNNFSGKPDSILASKLKAVKVAIKSWSNIEKEKRKQRRSDLEAKIGHYDKNAEDRLLNDEERAAWADLKKERDAILKEEVDEAIQRSRVKWALDGDENTSFFHGMVNYNNLSKRINGFLDVTIGARIRIR